MYRLPPPHLSEVVPRRGTACVLAPSCARALSPASASACIPACTTTALPFVGPLRIAKLRTSRHIGHIVIVIAVRSRANHRRDISR